MRDLRTLDRYRFGPITDSECGAFIVPFPAVQNVVVFDSGVRALPLDPPVFLRVIASTGLGWDHVSVSLGDRCPTWPEMEHVKRMFFEEDETAMQLHVPPTEHISFHHHCLHIWAPNDGRTIPVPPKELVGAPLCG